MAIWGTFCIIEVCNDNLHTSIIQKVPPIAIDRPYLRFIRYLREAFKNKNSTKHMEISIFWLNPSPPPPPKKGKITKQDKKS